jgi:hypothetical protein
MPVNDVMTASSSPVLGQNGFRFKGNGKDTVLD